MQTGVAKGLKVPCLFMITEVSIRCQKNPGGWYTPYTRVYPQSTTGAKARSEVEPDDVEQGDSVSAATTTPITISSVVLQDVSMRESKSMSTEVAGSVTTHPQLLPEGGHPPVGGRGDLGSADSLQVGVATLGYPGGLADPLDSNVASDRPTDAQSIADSATAISTAGSQPTISRQPPTVADTTAAAFQSPTHARRLK